MNEATALAKMIAPGTPRPGKYRQGVIQIWVTRACDKACYGCTQGSNLSGKAGYITPPQFEQACLSLKDYWGVVGMFGGNPAMHPYFEELCEIMKRIIAPEQRGVWSNNPLTERRAAVMRATFNPAVSNLNVHLDRRAYELFKEGWPECNPVGLRDDSRHSPPFVAMRDVLKIECEACRGLGGFCMDGREGMAGVITQVCEDCKGSGEVYDEEKAWELIADCDINKHWSAMIGVFRGELRAWFCEIAGAQAMLHQDEPDYPDTGINPCRLYDDGEKQWWQLPMHSFTEQVRKHCHDCGVPLRGHGELSQAADGIEQTSLIHLSVYPPKRIGRIVQLVTVPAQLGARLENVTRYIQNGRR